MFWIINLVICAFGVFGAYSRQSALIIFWLYGAYVGSIGLFKYSLNWLSVQVDQNGVSDEHAAYYALSNLLFLMASLFFFRIFGAVRKRNTSPSTTNREKILFYVLLSAYFVGAYIYVQAAAQLDYELFVNFDGSAWGQVFFYLGASLIPMVAARRKFAVAIWLCSPYVLLSVLLGVRSFLALSVFPLLLVLIFNIRTGEKAHRDLAADKLSLNHPLQVAAKKSMGRRVSWMASVVVGLALFVALQATTYSKLGEFEIPEGKLIEYYSMVTHEISKNSNFTKSESVERFLWGPVSPILKQFGFRFDRENDPQAIFATYINDYAGRLDEYFHYPSLWQADTYAAYGFWGLMLAPFWALMLLLMERFTTMNEVVRLLCLPLLCWVVFMFSRGAVGNATISVSYIFLIQLVFAMFIKLRVKFSRR